MLKFTLAKATGDVSNFEDWNEISLLFNPQVLIRRASGLNGLNIIGMQFFSTKAGGRNRTDTRNINIEDIKNERQMSSAMRM